ncbi:MAG: UDP-N-acetylglucosamine--N-acetylmuramyl-(pentapeptide) pyrophosphoryl-undecaprenol N-acetylglucosamine transferase, partial [Acetobacter sp.]|nr:UDP-N-acetylglucosamine--N-acetylmuramyl-(pentapeptide) pyrophosphoryl-undecaprenol N-acetylglucosamine transferase [Acetobacter sp.]
PFFHHVTDLLKKAHLVIGRSGGSSVAEITAAGRPSILVPLPFAASDEQTANARVITQANASWMIPQSDFTAVTLATQLKSLFMNPEKITLAAQAAAKLARPYAAEHLANVLEEYLVFSSHRFTSL